MIKVYKMSPGKMFIASFLFHPHEISTPFIKMFFSSDFCFDLEIKLRNQSCNFASFTFYVQQDITTFFLAFIYKRCC